MRVEPGTLFAPFASMNRASGWKVGSFKGVDIRLHITLLVILPYIVFITTARFGELTRTAGLSPGDLTIAPTIWGVILAFLLFSSVLLHEFGHVFIALRQGARVRSITLMMLGGVSDMDEIPARSGQEFRLAIIGPLVSLALSAVGYGLFRVSKNPNLSFVSLWFAQANFVLAFFNLLPAFPLDGGRAWRSLMAARIGRLRATRLAARIGAVFAWIFGIVGLLSLNIFLILIAFFLHAAAQTELSLLIARSLLKGLRVGDVATAAPGILGTDSLESATRTMLRNRITLLPVRLSEGFSVISLQQIQTVPPRLRATLMISDLLKSPTRLLDPGEDLEGALSDLLSTPARALPVGHDGSLSGFIRHADLSDILQLRSLEERISEAA